MGKYQDTRVSAMVVDVLPPAPAQRQTSNRAGLEPAPTTPAFDTCLVCALAQAERGTTSSKADTQVCPYSFFPHIFFSRG
ncbi:MAG: hypothetical protein KKD66_27055 [Proteobacteria bacterium]|nr:hypothetical protein [Pseudomonadota bacterium]